MPAEPEFPTCPASSVRPCYQIVGGHWFPCPLSAADAQVAEQNGCEVAQSYVNGATPAGIRDPVRGTGLTKAECKLLYTRYPSAIKRDPATGLLTLPLVPKGTEVQINPEPHQVLDPEVERLFDLLFEADQLMTGWDAKAR